MQHPAILQRSGEANSPTRGAELALYCDDGLASWTSPASMPTRESRAVEAPQFMMALTVAA